MTGPARLVFLCMDAGDKHLIRQMAAEGQAPALRSLLEGGLVGDTESVDGFYEGATWPSFYTGMNPGRHGFHRLVQLRPGTYELVPVRPGDVAGAPPFWQVLSDAGRRVAVLDVPLAAPSQTLNGIHLVEWGSHDAAYGFRAWPSEVEGEVIRRFGRHPAGTRCDGERRSPKDFRDFSARLVAGVEAKCRLTRHYLEQGGWDFFGQVFTEGHCAGHQCWHLHDPAHPDHDPAFAAAAGDPVREVYRAIDGAIGEIVHAAGPDTLVVFLASHRMAPNRGADFLLDEMLFRLGVMVRPQAGTGARRPSAPERGAALARSAGRPPLPRSERL